MDDVVLEVGVARADERQVGHGLLRLAAGVDLPPDADERVLRRRVAVRRRKGRRPLDVRHRIRTAGGQVHRAHAEIAEHPQQLDRLGQVVGQRVRLIHAEAAVVGQGARERERLAVAVHHLPGHDIEQREPHADQQPRALRLYPLDERGEQPRAAREVTPPASRPAAGREELVEEIPVAGLDIDHVEAGRFGVAGRREVGLDQPLDVGIGEQAGGVARVNAVAGVEQRMMVGDPRDAARGHGLAEPPGVGELQGHDQVVVAAKPVAMGRLHLGEQGREPRAAAGRRAELVGVGPALGLHGHGLASPDQLGAAEPEVPPAAEENLGGGAVGAAVPALHRMDAPAVADGPTAERERLGERRAGGGGERRVVERNRRGERGEVRAEFVNGAEPSDAGIG